MNKHTFWNIAGVVVLILLFSISAVTNRGPVEESFQETPQAFSTRVTIEGLYTDKEVLLSAPKTVLEVLKQLDEADEEMQLVIKEYAGLGALVESIGDKTNGTNGKYWQYRINGVMPQIGADALTVQDEDVIEWYFTESDS